MCGVIRSRATPSHTCLYSLYLKNQIKQQECKNEYETQQVQYGTRKEHWILIIITSSLERNNFSEMELKMNAMNNLNEQSGLNHMWRGLIIMWQQGWRGLTTLQQWRGLTICNPSSEMNELNRMDNEQTLKTEEWKNNQAIWKHIQARIRKESSWNTNNPTSEKGSSYNCLISNILAETWHTMGNHIKRGHHVLALDIMNNPHSCL